MNEQGWRPLSRPRHSGERAPSLVASPFMRLARVHAAAAGSDAALAVALAGSIFFSISPDAARWRVALYLAVTVAPFAVVTPLIGPAIDRLAGGRRAMIIATTFGRLVVAFFMIRHIETLWLFPLAFALLVLQKSYAVAKSAVVPRYVQSETDLVDANSRLALISALIGMLGAAVGGGFSLIGGSGWAAGVAVVGYLAATVLAFRLPRVRVATAPPQQLEKAELRSATIVMAGSAMAVLRGVIGFVTFFLAFEFRGGEDGLDVGADGAAVGGLTATARNVDITGDPSAPVWHFGLVVVAAGVGALFGARVAPRLRARFTEETMLVGVLAAVTAMSVLAALFAGLFGATLLALAVASGAGAGKLAFDALVQRDAPDANYGRSFARFEARFQIAWVIGAFIPTAIPLGPGVGATMVAIAVGFALVSYVLGRAGRRPVLRRRVPDADGTESGPDDTVSLDVEPLATNEVEAPPDRPPVPDDAWWSDPTSPTVSTVDGVQVDPQTPSRAVVDESAESTGPQDED